MNAKFVLSALLIITVSSAAASFTSEYAGEQNRKIKGLSQDDIKELQLGKGWGLAKPAELNGMPGPVHLLEMSEKIHLSEEQHSKISALYSDMKSAAIPLGKELIELEIALDTAFSEKTITIDSLSELIENIEKVRAKLRMVHLSTHLKTPDILSAHQVALYNELRGYSQNPCANIPEGHSAKMWKKHNGCE